MYCPNCHKNFDVDYWRCPECGAPLAEKQDAAKSGGQGFGIASMALGILAIVSIWLVMPAPAWIFAVLSIILGIVQLARSTKKGMAIAGIIMSGLTVLITCIYIILIVMAVDTLGDSFRYYQEEFIEPNRPGIEYNLENSGEL